MEYLFSIMFLMGVAIFLYCYFRQRELIRIEWDKVAKFIAIMVFITAIRFGTMSIFGTPNTAGIGFADLPFVFWEDSFFAILGIYFFKDYLKLSKKFWLPIAIVFSTVFAYGHLSYGVTWAIITLIGPAVSYYFGKKYGFGTSMTCHIIYDFITLLSVKVFLLLNMFKGVI